MEHKHNYTLFVSIHADGFTDPSVYGTSVFYLSLKGTVTTLEKYIEKTENELNNNYNELIFQKKFK
uniref:N-acetylmuramoyl-L-alanine amidase n=1 Tax=Providencia stuartii TaxID=588 RepID=A0AAI9DFG7_PROST|nr:N-acetylmuramoyl-L-alanine amidase [Providencia stuartii]